MAVFFSSATKIELKIHNSLENRDLRTMASTLAENTSKNDPELARLAEVWPSLNPAIRRAIVSMALAAGGKAGR